MTRCRCSINLVYETMKLEAIWFVTTPKATLELFRANTCTGNKRLDQEKSFRYSDSEMGIKKARRLQDLMDRARAVWDFAGAAAGDLPFTAGDVIVVTGKQGEWWQVRTARRSPDCTVSRGRGRRAAAMTLSRWCGCVTRRPQGHLEAKPRVTGSFPANYVERLPADAVASPAAAPAPAAAAAAAAAAALQGAGGATAAFGRAVFASSVASAAPRGPARPGIAITAPAAPAVARGGGGGPTPAAPPVASMTARPAKAASAAPRAGAAASDSPVRCARAFLVLRAGARV